MSKGRIVTIIAVVLLAIGVGVFLARDYIYKQFFTPTQTSNETGVTEAPVKDIEVLAKNLDIPWEVAFLPDGKILVTERSGTLLILDDDTTKRQVSGVEHVGEGGLMGLAVHPNFAQNNYIYLYLTTREGEGLTNRVDRYTLEGTRLADRTEIISNIPGANYHDGGRIAFGPDGKLYVTTGDAGNTQLAQSESSLAGKILRLNDDGTVPDDNPFDDSLVYSLGHRNAQGLAWDDKDRLWATEHGPSGSETGNDEVNLIEAGNNYGWPNIRGDQEQVGMQTPKVQSGSDEIWAPGGVAYYDGSLFFAGLRGETLYEANLKNERITKLTSHFREKYGRLRAVTLGPDKFLYLTTSNTDGRGDVSKGDDKLIRVNPEIFRK